MTTCPDNPLTAVAAVVLLFVGIPAGLGHGLGRRSLRQPSVAGSGVRKWTKNRSPGRNG